MGVGIAIGMVSGSVAVIDCVSVNCVSVDDNVCLMSNDNSRASASDGRGNVNDIGKVNISVRDSVVTIAIDVNTPIAIAVAMLVAMVMCCSVVVTPRVSVMLALVLLRAWWLFCDCQYGCERYRVPIISDSVRGIVRVVVWRLLL